ncbi:MAG TPA: response regulator [Methanomicrobiales archaeon]|nr:response regulator [Methanomicrobiales archaeon]
MRAKILVVEDEFITAADIQSSLEDMGFEVPATADTGEAAIQKAGELSPDLVLMDITLIGGMTGIEAAEKIGSLYGIPVIFLTAHSEMPTLDRALASNPFGYVLKPFEPSSLRASIEMALYKHGMEERLRESERTIQVLLNAVPDALVLLNRETRIVAVNRGMAGKLGKPPGELMGAGIADLIRGGALGISQPEMDRVFTEGVPVRFEEEEDGRWFQTAMYPIRDQAGKITRIAIQSHDITDRKTMEEQMRREGLVRIEQNMEQFLALNDQIRNPLQVIEGYVELSDDRFKDRIRDQIRIIDDLVTRLDQGWIESEKVRSFLIRHFRQSDAPGTGTCETRGP